MARITFTQNFDYKPTPRVIFAYRAGETYTVKRECADLAVAAGKGKEIKATRRRVAD